jgi:threonylcarbamoyladenosine tRNA methylthiotransferase MtaB
VEGTDLTMRVFLTSVGCKLNQSEVESWARHLAAFGCEVVADPAVADLYVVNTCTVTHVAAHKSRQLVRRCHRTNPQAQVVVTGCYAEMSPAEASCLPGVSLVLGTAGKEHLTEAIAERLGLQRVQEPRGAPPIPFRHTRAWVKIQDGCDNACTYCIVRIARGRQRSRLVPEILAEILTRQAEGYQEMVLTGVHIGAYGHEHGTTLATLIETILAQTQFRRLRLTSIEPWDVTGQLLALWEDPRLCRHLHLPLQSGCDATLQRMNRRYTTAHYHDLVRSAREAISDLAVTTDVIVGFPGEDEGEYATSAAFVAAMEFARIHVFPFSARPGTVATALPNAVPPPTKDRRIAQMLSIARQSATAFHGRFLGRTMDVLWESGVAGRWSGLTDNYIRVEAASHQNLHNLILPVRLCGVTEDGLYGELLMGEGGTFE